MAPRSFKNEQNRGANSRKIKSNRFFQFKKVKNIEPLLTKLENADLIFLNTCSIREKAEETVHNRLTSIEYLKKRKPGVIIGVLGCMAQN